MTKKILFDPGYAPIVASDIGQVGVIYYMFLQIKDLKLKKARFPMIFAKIERILKTNVAFYLGCILWASYISHFCKGKLEGNMLQGENVSEEEYTSEIKFLIDFVENKMERDYKYYLGNSKKPDTKYLNILKTYKDFLILNKGFCECAKAEEIKMPKYLKVLNDDNKDEVYNTIQKAIKENDIELLFNCYDLIF